MKKFIYLILSLYFVENAKCQMNPAFHIGFTSSNLKSDLFESTPRNGYNAGLSFMTYYGDKVMVNSDFYIETAGANTKAFLIDPTGENHQAVDYKQHFVSSSFALLGHYHFYKETFGILFGPHVGMLEFSKVKSSENISYKTDFYESDDTWVTYVDNKIREFNYGITFGLSAKKEAFVFDLRYNLGLKNYKLESYDATGLKYYSIKRNSFQLTLTYILQNVEIITTSPGM